MMDIIEIMLINIHQPIFNIQNKYEIKQLENVNKEILNLSKYDWIEINDFIFKSFEFENKQKRNVTELLSIEEKKERQKIGIEKAKANGIYKGRQPKNIDFELWETLYKKWKNKEITATECYKTLKISANTFYRKVHIYEETGKLS
jgi:DNA-binding NtrC family response regulator